MKSGDRLKSHSHCDKKFNRTDEFKMDTNVFDISEILQKAKLSSF